MTTGSQRLDHDDLPVFPVALSGWKVARLEATVDGREARFVATSVPLRYGPADLATCHKVSTHVPPEEGCTCGFYAWKHRSLALRMLRPPFPALLRVDLAGRFHEYERGYVAAVQTVRHVQVLGQCGRCLDLWLRREPVALAADPLAWREWTTLEPVCEQHLDSFEVAPPLPVIAGALGVDVEWLPVTDEVELHLAAQQAERSLTTGAMPAARTVEDLSLGDVGHVFQQELALDVGGRLWLNSRARLMQPLPGVDVPVRCTADGFEALIDGLRLAPPGWRPRGESRRQDLPVRAVGQPLPVPGQEGAADVA